MRIGWATPFNYRSAIGKFSLAVANELQSRGHQVEILRTESGAELELAPLTSDLSVTSCHDSDVRAFDTLIVNFGNHVPYHAQVIPLLAQRSAFGIFHDAEMRDFEWGLEAHHRQQIPTLLGFQRAELADLTNSLVATDAQSLLATLGAMCWGAMVHAPHYREVLTQFCPGSVSMANLCYPDPGVRRNLQALPGDRKQVVIFGVINEHKQPKRLMRALAALRPRYGPIDLHLAGAAEDYYQAELHAFADELGIERPTLHGYVSDEELQDLVEGSHAVAVLRYPVTEGGSASLATALYRGRPTIVCDVASYSLVPDRLVSKVAYGQESEDLAEALAAIFDKPEEAQSRALQARGWADEAFAAATYADELLDALVERPRFETVQDLALQAISAAREPTGKIDHHALIQMATAIDWFDQAQAPSSG